MAKKLQISDVLKKDARVVMYLFIFGGVTIISNKYLQNGNLAVLFGAIADYVSYRVITELKNEGYGEALK